MQIVDVYRIHSEIAQTAAELIFQEARRHAVTALYDFLGLENARLDVLTVKIFVGFGRHRAVGREVAALRANNEFLARETFLRKLLESRADAPLAALETIIDSSIDDIDAVLDSRDDRSGVAAVSLVVGLA